MHKIVKYTLSILILIIIIAGLLYSHFASSNNRARQLIKSKLHNTVVIEKSFPALGNLEGFLVHFRNSPTDKAIIYADKKGRYLVIGNIIDNHGKNVTMEETAQYIHTSLSEEAYLAALKLPAIWQGNKHAKHVITLVIDPNSPLFSQQYESLATYVAQGNLAIRWLLVNYLKPFGDQTAAAILQSSDPETALKINADKYNFATQTGGVTPVHDITAQSKEILENNWDFMQLYKLSGTPVSLFKTQDNKVYMVQGFLMDEMLENVINSVVSADQESGRQ